MLSWRRLLFSPLAVAAAIFTAPPQNRAIFKAPTCAISSAKKIASERRFSLRLKGTNLIPTAEFPAIPESAAKIASVDVSIFFCFFSAAGRGRGVHVEDPHPSGRYPDPKVCFCALFRA